MKLNIVSARTGFLWVKLGIRTFLRQPLALCGLFFMYMTFVVLLSVVPFIGTVLALAVVPAATLGLMVATQEAESGRFPMPRVLLSAFRAGRQRVRAMLVLGLIYAACCVAIGAITPLLVDVPPPSPADTTGAVMLTPAFQMSLLLGMALYTPVALMFWHAPALVHWHGISPVKSLFFSTVACLRNGKAMLLYALAWGGVFFLGSIVVGLVAAFSGSPQAGVAMLMPIGLLLTVMFTTSLYFTFRDSFVATPENETPSPGETP
ncbi:MAG: BPSS1780 family membrane protein [Pseudomonadota bacterium]